MTKASECLRVVGMGSDREAALEHATKQARQFYGDAWSDDQIVEDVGEASVSESFADGFPAYFHVDVTYRWRP